MYWACVSSVSGGHTGVMGFRRSWLHLSGANEEFGEVNRFVASTTYIVVVNVLYSEGCGFP